MPRILFITIIATLFFSCTKESKEEQKLLINATSTIEQSDLIMILKTNKIGSKIAFIEANDFPQIHSKEVVSSLIDKAKYKSLSGYQYKEYLPKGEYIILMQINDLAYSTMSGIYTFKKVSTLNGSASFENIMQFKFDKSKDYQIWVDVMPK